MKNYNHEFKLFKNRLQNCLSSEKYDEQKYNKLQEEKYIFIPKLYRYMPATEENINQYLIKNKIKLSTANFYSDKKDTTFYVNRTDIENYLKSIMPSTSCDKIIAFNPESNDYMIIPTKDIEIKSDFLEKHENDDNFIKLDSVGQKCFTASYNSQYHWTEYTNNEGFCVEYDFKKLDFNSYIVHNIFPVFYLDNPKFNILEYMGNWLNLYYLTLIKEEKYEMDNEWRLIQIIDDLYEFKDEIVLPKPDCVYFSKNIEKENKEMIIKICEERNIKIEE